MAILTSEEVTTIRRLCADELGTVNYTKPQVNAAIQGVEDWFETNRSSLVVAINAATGQFIFIPAQKRAILKYWLRQKFERGG